MTARIMLVPDWLRTTPVAHRGLHDANRQVPENSLAAFLLAIEHGFAIECDIRLSRDGVPMVFHDATLERLCQRKEALRDLTAEQLTLAPLAGTAETIPTLGDMLRLVNGQVPLLIEVTVRRLPMMNPNPTASGVLAEPIDIAETCAHVPSAAIGGTY